jgi:YfiH family protein
VFPEPEKLPTAVDESFRIEPSDAGRILIARQLQAVAPHLFSTRELEFRSGTEEGDYARVARFLDVLPEAILRVRQVHGRVIATARPHERWSSGQHADAIVCTDPARAVSVRVADCVPVLIADQYGRAVAAIHAGWRGTAARVSEAVVDVLIELGIGPPSLVVAIGPSIGPCCYQVDSTVRKAFDTPEADAWFSSDGPDHWRLDLARANTDQLVARGVPVQQIQLCGLCTRHDGEKWHSFRRDGAAAGRMVAAIRLRPAGSQ